MGLQNALDRDYPYQNNIIALFPNACKQKDGTFNCTAACLDTTNITTFSDLETLHNCAVFPEIFVNLAKNNVTANARRIAEDLNIKPSSNPSSIPSIVSNKIQTCLIDSCTSDEDCNKTMNGTNSYYQPNNLTGSSFITNVDNSKYFALCGRTSAFVDADVGGIGV